MKTKLSKEAKNYLNDVWSILHLEDIDPETAFLIFENADNPRWTLDIELKRAVIKHFGLDPRVKTEDVIVAMERAIYV